MDKESLYSSRSNEQHGLKRYCDRRVGGEKKDDKKCMHDLSHHSDGRNIAVKFRVTKLAKPNFAIGQAVRIDYRSSATKKK